MNVATLASKPTVAAYAPRRLLWAGAIAIAAEGIGFGIRGGILDNWGAEFGFTATQLGVIGGAGFSGYCFGILVGGLLCDRIGYGKLIAVAFILHVLSAVVTFTAVGASAYSTLYWGMFIFAYANGTLEAVVNPLVATLFPKKRMHYLNVLNAGWPAGLAVGAALGWWFDEHLHWDWRLQLAIYLVPTLAYAVLFFGQRMPMSEASKQGLKLGEMLQDVGVLGALPVCYLLGLFGQEAVGLSSAFAYGFAGLIFLSVGIMTRFAVGSVLLFVLFTSMALIGAMEIGTDGWIQNITGNLLTPEQGKVLFVLTSVTMLALRFGADFIEQRLGLSPVSLLFVCAIVACLGLHLSSSMVSFGGAMFALLIYTMGKTFFWPTMLALASDRFPRTGAIAIALLGGIGMMSAGLIGTPGLGYAKDRFASEALRERSPTLYEQYKATTPSRFLFLKEAHGLDGKKLAEAQADVQRSRAQVSPPEPDKLAVYEASVAGDRQTLKIDALIPASLAVIFGILVLYFRKQGGYRPKALDDNSASL